MPVRPQSPLARFAPVIIAAVLGLVPYVLFLGISNRVVLNGEVVRDEHINLLGIVLALIGIAIVFSVLRPSAPKDGLRKALAAVAGLLCVLQLAASVDVIRPLDWLNRGSDLPPLTYSGLDDGNRDLAQGIVDRGDIEEITRSLAMRVSSTLGLAQIHADYADVCMEGRRRIDVAGLEAELLAPFPEGQREDVLANVEVNRRTAPLPEDCSPTRERYAMGEIVDNIARQRDMIAIIADGYTAMSQP